MKETGLILGAILVGGGVYFLNTKKAIPAIVTASKTVKPAMNTAELHNKWVFVNSISGEQVYSAISSLKSVINGHGKDPILRLPNNVEAGIATGVLENSMIQLRSEIDGKPYTFWIDASKAKVLDSTQRDFFVSIAKRGRRKTVQELRAIANYFKSK